MASIQRKFAVGLITLFIVSLTSYTGQTTKRTPDGCDKDCILANQIRECLNNQGIIFENVSVTNGHIEVVLKANTAIPVSCTVIDAIVECANKAVRYEPGHNLAISIPPSTPRDPVYLVYKGHTGTGTIPDTMSCVNVPALKAAGTLSVNFCKVESIVYEEAKQRGARIEKLNVKFKKFEGDKLCLQVSGKVRESELSERGVIGMITSLVYKYTGVPCINTDNLKVLPTNKPKAPPQSGKDSRIK
jgi:hypothetical protein